MFTSPFFRKNWTEGGGLHRIFLVSFVVMILACVGFTASLIGFIWMHDYELTASFFKRLMLTFVVLGVPSLALTIGTAIPIDDNCDWKH